MPRITTLFIDKGGVLIDNSSLSPQYRRLLGEFLPTELGGDPDAWAKANVGAAQRSFGRYRAASITAPSTSIRDWYAEDVRRWLYEMCDEVGRARPPTAEGIASRMRLTTTFAATSTFGRRGASSGFVISTTAG
jgi:hypothetical protein